MSQYRCGSLQRLRKTTPQEVHLLGRDFDDWSVYNGNIANTYLDKTAGTFSYTRTEVSGLVYTVWTSADLMDWGTVPAAATQVPRDPAVDGVHTVDVTLTPYTPPSLINGRLHWAKKS